MMLIHKYFSLDVVNRCGGRIINISIKCSVGPDILLFMFQFCDELKS